MPGSEYYERVGQYFSHEVDALDERDLSNPIHAYIRRESLATLKSVFTRPARLLEFGYGTGTEAISLAREGFEIVGVDPSPAMRERAREKARTTGVLERCDFRLGSTADAHALAEEFGEASFDGAFSTLGPLNCEPDLPQFARSLQRALRPRSALVALVVNRFCAWETLLYLGAGRFRKAFRRQAAGWSVFPMDSTGRALPVFTYTPASFERAFGGRFLLERCFALPVILPPPYAAARLETLGGLLGILERADERLRGAWPAAWLSDHFEAVLRRHPP